MTELGWRVVAVLIFVAGAVMTRIFANDPTLAGALAGSAATLMLPAATMMSSSRRKDDNG